MSFFASLNTNFNDFGSKISFSRTSLGFMTGVSNSKCLEGRIKKLRRKFELLLDIFEKWNNWLTFHFKIFIFPDIHGRVFENAAL
jgi:hypothetical protein